MQQPLRLQTTSSPRAIARLASYFGTITGGVVLLALASCTLTVSTGGSPANGGNGDDTQPPGTIPAFTVTLGVSNSTPQINEEVIFRCTPSGDIGQGASFSFQTADVSLQVNTASGTATFIVTESELDLSVDITCTATDAEGNTATSTRVTIFPTS